MQLLARVAVLTFVMVQYQVGCESCGPFRSRDDAGADRMMDAGGDDAGQVDSGFDGDAGSLDGGPDAGVDAGAVVDAGLLLFADSFERANAAALGNGWLEKNPSLFSLADGGVVRGETLQGYEENLVYRAPSDDQLDVTASVELQFSDSYVDWPQIFVRADAVAVTGYFLWIEDGTQNIDLARQLAGGAMAWTTLAQLNVPPYTQGARYRMTLGARGASPVELYASWEVFDGGTWLLLDEASAVDADPQRFIDAGTWGFGGHLGTSAGPYRYDQFELRAR